MAYPILGTPVPAFFDTAGAPLASGTISILDPADDSVKASYPTADDANASTNGTSGDITLNSRGEPTAPNQLWGRDGEDYKIVIKDSAGSTVLTMDDIRMPDHSTGRGQVTFGTSDTTPTIAESKTFACNATTAAGIADFDDDETGDTIFVRGGTSAVSVIAQNASVNLDNGSSCKLAQEDTIMLHKFPAGWYEMGRMRNGKLRGAVSSDRPLTDTTLADVSGLSAYALMYNTHYKVTGFLKVISDGNTQDIKFALQTDNAFQDSLWQWVNTNEAGTTETASVITTTGDIADIVTGTVHGIAITGFVQTHATLESVVDFQAAQGTDAGTTTIETGSWLAFEEMATI